MRRRERILADRKPSERDLKRLQVAQKAWQSLHHRLEEAGIDHSLFGSLKHGGFKAHSDIDVMIYGELNTFETSATERIISDVYREFGIEIDYMYAIYLTERRIRELLEG